MSVEGLIRLMIVCVFFLKGKPTSTQAGGFMFCLFG